MIDETRNSQLAPLPVLGHARWIDVLMSAGSTQQWIEEKALLKFLTINHSQPLQPLYAIKDAPLDLAEKADDVR